MKNVCPFKMPPINLWLKHQQICVILPNTPGQFSIKDEVDILAAMRTLTINLDRKSLVT